MKMQTPDNLNDRESSPQAKPERIDTNYSDILAKRFGLIPLRMLDGGSRFEIRFWTNIGLDDEKVIVIHRVNDNYKGSFLIREEFRENRFRVKLRELAPPRSGWIGFQEFLFASGLIGPFDLQPDPPDTVPIVDEGILFYETKRDDEYRSIHYGQYSRSPDGRRFLDFCARVEVEFNVDLGCTVAE